jgi:hypothetical protein
MQAVDGTKVVPAGDGTKRTHTIHLSGQFMVRIIDCMLPYEDYAMRFDSVTVISFCLGK